MQKQTEIKNIKLLETEGSNGVSLDVETYVEFEGQRLLIKEECETHGLTYWAVDKDGNDTYNPEFVSQLVDLGMSKVKANALKEVLG